MIIRLILKIRLSIANICAEKCQLYNVYFMFERAVQMVAVILCCLMLLQYSDQLSVLYSESLTLTHVDFSSTTQLNRSINYILLFCVRSNIIHVLAPAMVHIGKLFVYSQQFVRTARC